MVNPEGPGFNLCFFQLISMTWLYPFNNIHHILVIYWGGKDGLVSTVRACAQISFISRKTLSNFCCISKRIRLRTRCLIQLFLSLSRTNDIPRSSVPSAFTRPRIPDTVVHRTITTYSIRCYPDYQKIW